MLFRKLELNWRYGISELLIVVCGVLIALAAEGWRQDLQDRSAERDYVERLRCDIALDTVTLSSLKLGFVGVQILCGRCEGGPRCR